MSYSPARRTALICGLYVWGFATGYAIATHETWIGAVSAIIATVIMLTLQRFGGTPNE